MCKIRTGSDLQHDIRYTVFFRLLARANIRMKNCKRSHDLDPPIEAKMPHDNLDSIGRFKSYDHLQFCIPFGSSKPPEKHGRRIPHQTHLRGAHSGSPQLQLPQLVG